jgi:CRP-like cAMP-binding protein
MVELGKSMEVNASDQSFQRLLVGYLSQRALKTFKKGEKVPLDTKNIWIVYSGYMQVSTLHASGDESILGFLGPLMPVSLKLSFLATYEAIALTDVELLQFSVEEIENSPELLHAINLQTIRCLRQAEALLWANGKRPIIDRLRDFLYLIAREFGQSTAEGVRIDFRLRHYQIANAIGTTRVTASRFLRELREQGVFHVGKDKHMYIRTNAESSVISTLLS